MNITAKRAAALGRKNKAARLVREHHAARDWFAVRMALWIYWDAKRDWEALA